MRKSFNTLSALVGQQEDLLEGDAYLFVSRNRKRVKVLWFDGTGICLLAKRLEKGRFAAMWDRGEDIVLTANELWLFLEGCSQLGKMSLSPPEYSQDRDGRLFP
jgi:transposase